MRKLIYRFLAYVTAGISGGFAVWLLIRSGLNLGMWRGGLAILLATLGILAVVYLLRKTDSGPSIGIRTNPKSTVHVMDLVCIVAAVIAMFFIVDGFSQRLGGPSALVADPLASDVIAFMFLPCALILALFVAQTGGQSLDINSDGMVVTGPIGTARFDWHEVSRLRPDSQYVIVSRLGFPVPRHLRTNLQIIAEDERTAKIYEPGSAKDRRAILNAFKENAPAGLQHDLAEIEAAWSSRLHF